MIVVDTSALVAIILGEPTADRCLATLESSALVAISAGTLAEALLVAGRRNKLDEMQQLIDGVSPEIVDVTASMARLVADAYRRWGKGFHPAALNFGDCFAYALAAERGCPLLYVGGDFARTDIVAARPA